MEGTRLDPSSGVSTATRGAAIMHVALGLGFGIGTLVTLWHLARHGELRVALMLAGHGHLR